MQFYIVLLLFVYIYSLSYFISDSLKVSSTAMRSTAPRMTTSSITCAAPSWRSYVETCPRAFWTKAGRRHRPPLLRYDTERVIIFYFFFLGGGEIFVVTFSARQSLQASEHLRNLHMRNMVIKYCTRVQPEWKKQVCWAWTENTPQSTLFSVITHAFFTADEAKGNSQWDL